MCVEQFSFAEPDQFGYSCLSKSSAHLHALSFIGKGEMFGDL